ncbi:MAG: hypothetical protein AVDCRST_MAG39-967 [uncultured Sphingomonadaceae bacterium]|uniref:GtrA/DPMS transmembrane domain-containing protein n=1 Tax=uncultured Sphingomonadaceae bacterium TaxID=169976 RepID=A0A6J4SM43_9SPHN|nr:MAG: hypothetical protein AVDCRST_MAG39-967 [uncultured Sphingomonadaceae bacterium]
MLARLPALLRARLARGGRPLRFLVAGAANTAFGLAIYPALVWSSDWFYEHYMVALVLAQAMAVLFAFTTYRIAFGAKEGRARQFGLFTSFYLFNYVLNWLALPLLVEVGGIPPVAAQLGFTLLLIVGSYFWHSRVTFREGATG